MSGLTTINCDITLTAGQIKRLEESLRDKFGDQLPPTLTARIGGVAMGLLSDLADGGIMLSPREARKAVELVGSAADIVPTLEKAKNRRRGQYVVEIELDPSFEPVMGGIARSQGREISEVFKDAIDYCISQNWVYEFPSDIVKLFLTIGQLKDISSILGIDNPTGKDVVDFICTRAAEPATVEG